MPYISQDSNNHPVILPIPEGKSQETEPLYRCAMSIMEVTRGKDHPEYSVDLTNLATLLEKQVRPRPPGGRNCALLFVLAGMQVCRSGLTWLFPLVNLVNSFVGQVRRGGTTLLGCTGTYGVHSWHK